jgi:dihydroxyacetone kinase
MSVPGGATMPDGAGVDVVGAMVEGTAEVGKAGSVVAETDGTGVDLRCAAIAAATDAEGAPQATASAAHAAVARAIHPSRTRISCLLLARG